MPMRATRPIKLLAVLLALLALSGCFRQADTGPRPEDVAVLMAQRTEAVNDADREAYLSTVLPGDETLRKEEANLIRSSSGLGISDYKAEAGKPVKKDDGFTAEVTQSYTLGGVPHQCTYEALFASSGGKLYYDGPDFLTLQNDRVKICYAAGGEELARQALAAETAALDAMKAQLDFAPQGFVSVKLYADQQVFLQSVKLDLPAWVGGWQEYGEAIKTLAGAYPVDTGDFRSMLNHESTHRMVSELSNDNASYWIQEGLASVFQQTLSDPGLPNMARDEAGQDFTPYAAQKDINLERLGGADVMKYYATSKAFAAFLLDTYGWGKVRQALEYMKKYPLIPVTGAEKIPDTNARTDEAIRDVFGFSTDDDFQQAFDTWLNSLHA
jgi:hypothetical protein